MINNKIFHKYRIVITAFTILLLIIAGCNDDDEAINPDIVTDPLAVKDARVNNWIYGVMQELYYWTDEIPSNVDTLQEPTAFFNSLLSDNDRFSVIVPNYSELINSLSGVSKEAGYEFALVRVAGTDEVNAVVLYTKPGSPADEGGLQRGDVITKINGNSITLNNYGQLVQQIFKNHSITYKHYNHETSLFEEKGTLNLSTVVVAENPNYLDTVYTIGNHKIGYYVYNFFSPGTEGSRIYDDNMDAIISDFKSEGVDALVLDFRYNSGGAGSSATNLASLIGSGVNSSEVFYKNEYNDLLQNYFQTEGNGALLETHFIDKAENIGAQLNNQLYILTGSRTASASELVINGLKPYMNVTIIGDTTVGKNVGSIPIEDEQNPENDYGLLPIVFKVFNSNDQSNYDHGFIPSAENHVTDYSLPLKSLGDIEEPLLARAIELITGSSTGARKRTVKATEVVPLMNSIEIKPLVIDL